MRLHALWPHDPIVIEIGAPRADIALGLRQEGLEKYLGVSTDARRIATLQARHPEVAGQLTCSRRKKIVQNNNADVLILSGTKTFSFWRFRLVRHAHFVAWRCGFDVYSLLALVACLCHVIAGRCARPQIVRFKTPDGKTVRLFTTRVRRQKRCYRKSLHFIPHAPGLTGVFRQFEQQQVRHVVLRWFEALPEIEPTEDVDLLIADDSLGRALAILHALPGIQPCDVYSETGLARSDYRGTPYYPAAVARRILDGAVRHRDLCMVPGPREYFHSLAYHAVYHKGECSGLPNHAGLRSGKQAEHDYAGILTQMARQLGIDVEISLEGLHAYLQESGWGPSPEMIARLAAACRRNRWLQLLAKRVPSRLHDHGLTVFVLRQEAVKRGFQDKIIAMIREGGFEILATRALSPAEVEYSAARTRGGNWTAGPFEAAGGPPSVCVVAYDRKPLPLTRKQRRKFPNRTNARVFVKEAIRDCIVAELPPDQGCNALHSSDHPAEAWHLIEVFAPEMVETIQARMSAIVSATSKPSRTGEPAPTLRRAA